MASTPPSVTHSPARSTLTDAAVGYQRSPRPSAAHNMASTIKKEESNTDSADDEAAPASLSTRPTVSAERLLFGQFERLKQQKVQVDRAFDSSQQQLRECAGLLHEYARRTSANGTVKDSESAHPAVLGAPATTGETSSTDKFLDGLAERCVASTERAIHGTELLFRFLFERLYLHQLAANADFVDDFERVVHATAATADVSAPHLDEDEEKADRHTHSLHGPAARASLLRAQSVCEALDSLKQVPSAVQRFQADCQRVQIGASTPLTTSALTATKVFAVSALYDAEAQREIVSFLNGTLHVAALVLPEGVPEVELALWMHCCFLVSPATVMTTPILSMPRERMALVYQRSRHTEGTLASTTPAPSLAPLPAPAPTPPSGESMSALAETSAHAPSETPHAALTAVYPPSTVAEADGDQTAAKMELAAVADADAELLELLQLLDTQQRHTLPEWGRAVSTSTALTDRARSPFPYAASPSSEQSLAFPPTAGTTPRPEDGTAADTATAGPPAPSMHGTGFAREDSLSNTTAFSQSSLATQTGSGLLSQDPFMQRRARPTNAPAFTRHRQYNAAGATDDGLGRMSTATQSAAALAHPRKRLRPTRESDALPPLPLPPLSSPSTLASSSTYPSPSSVPVGSSRRAVVFNTTPMSGPGELTFPTALTTPTKPTSEDSAGATEAEEEEPVVVAASQQMVMESQAVRYNHAARLTDYTPLLETCDHWTTPAMEGGALDEGDESSNRSATAGGPRSHSDSDSNSLPCGRAGRGGGGGGGRGVPTDDDVSVGFASVHSPLEGAMPLMLPGTAGAMRAPPSTWRFQISNSVRDQRPRLVELIRALGGEVDLGSAFNPRTTHLVTAEGLTERTEKYLSACAAGILVVPPRCVLDSAQRGHWVHGQKMLEYNMNPCRRFLGFPSEYHGLPFAHWRVLLLTSHESVARGIRTVLQAGGCTSISVLVFDDKSPLPSLPEPSVAAALAAFTKTPLTHTPALVAHQPVELRGLNPFSPVDPALVCGSSHVLVECAEMSVRAQGTFQLPAWYPVCLMRQELYPRLFTLEILYHSLCSSLDPVFRPSTGELLSEDALIPACRVEPFV